MVPTTHEVTNQPPVLENYNLFTTDPILVEGTPPELRAELTSFGEKLGRPETQVLGFHANENPPVFKPFDRFGHRIDEVDYHPAYHALMSLSVAEGLHAAPWADQKPDAHLKRAAKMYLMSQVEFGHLCPISMTYSAVPTLRKAPEVAKAWEPRLTSLHYDPKFRPWKDKKGLTLGMGMTEKQGGSDVRANTTRAEPVGTNGEYAITGHKWFCSAPMSDGFLILAQAPKGLTCFLLPRWTPEDRRNAFFIQRLKDKLGNRSNASSEVEFINAFAWRVGEEGRGVPTIIEMVSHTRLDCAIGSAGLMRQALAQAIHHARHRSTFGKKLIDQPLMQNVLIDLALESQAATLLMLRLARAYDRQGDAHEDAFRRLATAIGKYWLSKRAPIFAAEALECLGGAGYVEESILPRIYRETPINSVWEGSGNVICLDVLRAIAKEPETLDALQREVSKAADPRLNDHFESARRLAAEGESQARRCVEAFALALQGSLLLRQLPGEKAELFLSSRITQPVGRVFGGLSLQGLSQKQTLVLLEGIVSL